MSTVAAALAPRTASANPRPLPFSYPWETLSKGQLEVEQHVDIIPLRAFDLGDPSLRKTVIEPRYELQTEVEYGITDRLELGFYLVMKNSPEEDGAGSPLRFDGVKQRLRYRIGDEGRLPVELSVYFEVAELHDEFELEQKLNLQKRFGQLKLLANLWVEEAFGRDGAVDFVAHPTAGLTYQVTPNLWAGAEYWMQYKIALKEAPGESAGDDFNHQPHHFLGPALTLTWDRFWWGTAAYARLDGLTRAMQPGDAFGHVYVRTVLGLEL